MKEQIIEEIESIGFTGRLTEREKRLILIAFKLGIVEGVSRVERLIK
jgi:hypothetical protein